MNVNEIRDRILEISHDEVAPDTGLQNKALAWMNSAYHELMDECMPYLDRYLQTSETVEMTDGYGQLSHEVYRAMKVVDIDNKRILKPVSYLSLLETDPTLEASGSPRSFYLMGDQVKVYPEQDTTLNIVYMPVVSDLSEGGIESTVLLPKSFHNALVWGGLVWGSVFERGFSSQGDLKLFQAKWSEAKAKVKLSLGASSTHELRVKPFDTA